MDGLAAIEKRSQSPDCKSDPMADLSRSTWSEQPQPATGKAEANRELEKANVLPELNLFDSKNNCQTLSEPADAAVLSTPVEQTQRAVQPTEAARRPELIPINDASADELQTTIQNLGLPRGWLEGRDRDPENWRNSTERLVGLALDVREYINKQNLLHTYFRSFRPELPPGMTVMQGIDGRPVLGGSSLPETWDLATEEDRRRVESLNQWLERTRSRVEPVFQQLAEVEDNPIRAVAWDDRTYTAQARLGEDGRVEGLEDRERTATSKHVNLMESRFDVSRTADGRIAVQQNVQAQRVPWWGYQNLIGVENIGRPMTINREFAPEDLVVVRNGDNYQLVRADEVGGFRTNQRRWHYGETAAVAALDVGMTLSGATAITAAARGLRLLRTAGAFGSMTEASLVRQAAGGAWRATLGSTGVLNNAGARESAVTEALMEGRNWAFLFDASRAVFGGIVRSGRAVASPNPFSGGPLERTGHLLTRGSQAALTPAAIVELRDAVRFARGRDNGRRIENGTLQRSLQDFER